MVIKTNRLASIWWKHCLKMFLVAVSLVVLFSWTFFPLLQVCNVYRFLIINSNFNLSFGCSDWIKILHKSCSKVAKGALKICSLFTGEHSCRSVISVKLHYNFFYVTLLRACSPVDLLHIFRISFFKKH